MHILQGEESLFSSRVPFFQGSAALYGLTLQPRPFLSVFLCDFMSAAVPVRYCWNYCSNCFIFAKTVPTLFANPPRCCSGSCSLCIFDRERTDVWMLAHVLPETSGAIEFGLRVVPGR